MVSLQQEKQNLSALIEMHLRNSIILFISIIPTLLFAHAGNDVENMMTNKGVNEPIVSSNNDIAFLFENNTIDFPVLNNDYAQGNGPLTMIVLQMPKHGTAEVMSDYTIRYTPEYRYIGLDELKYQICKDGVCSDAILFIEVANWDYKPIANDDHLVQIKGSEVTLDILSNDAELSDEPIILTILQYPKHGDSKINNDNTLTIAFESHYLGYDSLSYQICDAEGDCATANVYIELTNKDDLDIFIPSGLSPNGDGLNDLFIIPEFEYYLNYKQIELRIINRWGELVFEDNNYQNNWGGIANKGARAGSLLDSGVYYYLLTIEGISKQLTGNVYINK